MSSWMEWGQPQYFKWLWALPVIVVIFTIASLRKRHVFLKFADKHLLPALVASYSPWARMIKRALLLVVTALLVLALAQPHFRKKEITVEKKGVEVVIALDVSNSMLTKDIAPSRLEKAKLELSRLVDKLKQDKIGIVAFAGDAFIQCPLTLDKSAVKLFLSTISSALIQVQGTNLSNALDVCSQAFSKDTKDNQVIILLTDGEDHEGKAIEMAKQVRKKGPRIFAIGIGTPEGRTVPDETLKGIKKDQFGKPVISKLNEGMLKSIANEGGGIYFRSAKGDLEVDAMVYQIRQLSQKGFSKDKVYEYEENYQLLLAGVFILLVLEMLLSERKLFSRSQS